MNTTESYSHNKCKPPKQHNWVKSHNMISSSVETQLNTRFNIFTCWSAPAHVKMSELCLEKWDAHIQHTSSTSCRFSKQLNFVFASEKKLGYISRKRNNPEACFWWKITRNGCSWVCLGISKYEFQEAFLPNFCKRMAPSLALPRRCKTSVLVRPPPICPPLVFQQCRTAGNFSLRLLPSQSRFCAAAQPPTERIFTLLC